MVSIAIFAAKAALCVAALAIMSWLHMVPTWACWP